MCLCFNKNLLSIAKNKKIQHRSYMNICFVQHLALVVHNSYVDGALKCLCRIK
jgi:hypothetical protein